MSLKKLLILFLLLPSLVTAQSWQAESTDKQVAILELFTAEGCGLCPAADRWVEHLPAKGIKDDNLIVLGFHVDYLNDQKGWIDKFASPVFSDRQRQLARLNLYKTIFTPEFVISGEVVHSWRKHAKKLINAINTFDAEAVIKMQLKQENAKLDIQTKTDISGVENRQFSKLYIAVTEDNVMSKVLGGDNLGATFNHQNLVRKWLGPFDLNTTGNTQTQLSIDIDKSWKQQDLSIVALVQNLDDGFVLQGLSIPLTKK